MSGKSELKIFDDHPPQVVVESGYFEDVHPKASTEGHSNIIEFVIAASNVDYLDLNDSILSVRVTITKSDGTAIGKTDQKPVVANFMLYSLFSDATLTLNDTQIEGGSSLYSYKAAIESLLNFDNEAKNTLLYAAGFHKSTDDRHKWLHDEYQNKIELAGPLRFDFFNQPKYLIPGVSARITFTKASSDFVLSYKSGETEVPNGTWKVQIVSAVLFVRRVKVHPTVLKAHTLGLEKRNALYPYIRNKVISFSIPQGSTSYFYDNLFSSSLLPKVVIIALVKSVALTGSIKHDPFNFTHFDLTKMDLLRNGQSIPYRQGYAFDVDSGHYTELYVRSILQNMNLLNGNVHNGIQLHDFRDTQFLLIFNLTPDFDLKERQVIKDSNLRLDLAFKKPLPESINVIAYASFDATLQITKGREIIRDAYT